MRQVEELCHSARERDPGERGAFLAEACRGDEELRREVESLLSKDGPGRLSDLTVTLVGVGTQLGPYKIESPLGAGGMGQVFRARDTRLGRSVAIKIAHQEFSERFEREARAISALNHPNICTLYDVGPNYLVMELVEGDTLAARLRKGALPTELVVRYGVQIADALAAAHAQGITHRDLKPANIMVTKSGIKVLDFGLAKMTRSPANPETQTLTAVQTVIGTLAYMAPEQLEGKECDARSDIFSLGLVLYEMATGKRAFSGESQAALIAAAIRCEPPPLQAVPEKVAHAIGRCLVKDPADRWQTARDLKAELEWAAAGDFVTRSELLPRRALFPWIAGAAAAGASAGLAARVWRGKNSSAPVETIRYRLTPPEGTRLERNFTRQSLALSPMGGRVAMIATNGQGPMIWVQRRDSLTAAPLQGTEGATMVFWSPDGESIGFWAGGKLRKIRSDGGTPLPICVFPDAWSATWNEDGIIVAASARQVSSSSNTSRISVKSGQISPWRALDWPKFLPGGKHVLYVKPDPRIGGMRAYVAELSTGLETELMPTDTLAIFVPDQTGGTQGHLLFGRSATLLALRFDAERLRLSGEPVSVAKDVPFFTNAWSEFDASADGVLIFSAGSQKAQLTWVNRRGQELSVVNEPKEFFGFLRLSPDGKRVAADVFDFSNGATDIWTFDLSQPTAERVTFETGGEFTPVWSPDGTRIAFGASNTRSVVGLKVKAVGDRSSGEDSASGDFQFPCDWSSDGRWIFYASSGGDVSGQIWVASASERDRKLTPLRQTQFDSAFPTLSPSREYLAFSATDTGRYEIYVQRFDGSDSPKLVGHPRQVSLNGGNGPRWGRDGRELFFLSPDSHIMAVAVKPGSDPEFGTPADLFRLPTSYHSLAPVTIGYDVGSDGQRFLVLVRTEAGAPLQVVVNWQTELKG